MIEALKLIGAITGIVAFGWQIWDKLLSHLHIAMAVELRGQAQTASLTIENKGNKAKRIHYAGLLIGPDGETLAEAAAGVLPPAAEEPAKGTALAPMLARFTAHPLAVLFARRPAAVLAAGGSRAWIPVPAYYEDQARFGNEIVRERVLLDPHLAGAAGPVLKVRFIVFVRYSPGILRWRVTSDLAQVPVSTPNE